MGSDKDEKIARGGPLSILVHEWARVQRELLRLERDEEISQVADTITQLTAQMSEGTERTRQQARALGWGGGEGQYQERGRHTR
ncbi:unnamed protein product [Pylaiella littoralis]